MARTVEQMVELFNAFDRERFEARRLAQKAPLVVFCLDGQQAHLRRPFRFLEVPHSPIGEIEAVAVALAAGVLCLKEPRCSLRLGAAEFHDAEGLYTGVCVARGLPSVAHHERSILTLGLHDLPSHASNICTSVTSDDRPIETSLQRYDKNCTELAAVAARAMRVAVNSCLALTNYGVLQRYLFPADVERDRAYARDRSERGQKAKDRLQTAVQVVEFAQEVKLHRHEGGEPGEPTGREVTTHWRRGHWRAHPGYGEARARGEQVPLCFVKPVLVRADKFTGEHSDTSIVYK